MRTSYGLRVNRVKIFRGTSQGLEHDPDIVEHHADVGVLRVSWGSWKMIIAELVDISRLGLFRNLLQDGAGKDL